MAGFLELFIAVFVENLYFSVATVFTLFWLCLLGVRRSLKKRNQQKEAQAQLDEQIQGFQISTTLLDAVGGYKYLRPFYQLTEDSEEKEGIPVDKIGVLSIGFEDKGNWNVINVSEEITRIGTNRDDCRVYLRPRKKKKTAGSDIFAEVTASEEGYRFTPLHGMAVKVDGEMEKNSFLIKKEAADIKILGSTIKTLINM